jgi:microcystin degradation protein MlrC
VDPDVVELAWQRGVHAEIITEVGGKRDPRFAQPLYLTARVHHLFEARFLLSGHLARNMPIDMGLSAVLRCSQVYIIVTSRSGPHFAPQLFQAAGFDPFAASVLVAKSPCGFRAAYTAHAREILVIRAPGCAPSDFWNYEYRNIPRPIWPWDEIENWTPAPSIVPSSLKV